jgi:hypothetical protein
VPTELLLPAGVDCVEQGLFRLEREQIRDLLIDGVTIHVATFLEAYLAQRGDFAGAAVRAPAPMLSGRCLATSGTNSVFARGGRFDSRHRPWSDSCATVA